MFDHAGTALSTIDIALMSRPVGLRNRLTRWGFITLPFVGMATSYVVAKELSSNIAEKMGYDRHNYWTYFFAPMAPAIVAGVSCKCTE